MNKYSDIYRSTLSTRHFKFAKPFNSDTTTEPEGLLTRPVTINYSTPRISALTQHENEKILVSLAKSPNKNSQSSIFFNHVARQSCDFDSLLKSLDSITSGRVINTVKVLSEGKAMNINLNNGQVQCFKIFSKGKRSPLKVNLRRSIGKVKVFVSKSCESPNEENCDKLCLDDNFEFYDKGIAFMNECIFIAVEACGMVGLTVGISFGYLRNVYLPPEELPQKKKNLSVEYEEVYKNEGKRMELKKKVENLLKKRKRTMMKTSSSKNFVLMNRNVSSVISIKPLSSTKEKIQSVLQKKNQLYIDKKTHVLETITKKSSKLDLNITEKRIKDQQRLIIQKSWLVILHLCASAQALKSKFLNKKSNIFLNLHQSSSARLIQKVFKNKYVKISVKDNILLHARNNLFLFNSIYSKTKEKILAQLVDSIKTSLKATKIRIKFEEYIRKVSTIQKASKFFISRNRKRIEDIKKLWNSTFATMVLRKSSAVSVKYMKITPELRDEIVKKYYEEKFSNYMRSYTAKPEVRTGKDQLKEFVYMPSTEEIKSIIEKAAERPFK